MKSNDIIEAANQFLKSERTLLEDIKGHFVLKVQIKKKLGPYKEYIYEVFFVNNDLTPYPILYINNVFPVKDGQEDDNYRQMDTRLLELMFSILNRTNSVKHFIEGDYGTDRWFLHTH